jgi:hypothetical protein
LRGGGPIGLSLSGLNHERGCATFRMTSSQRGTVSRPGTLRRHKDRLNADGTTRGSLSSKVAPTSGQRLRRWPEVKDLVFIDHYASTRGGVPPRGEVS